MLLGEEKNSTQKYLQKITGRREMMKFISVVKHAVKLILFNFSMGVL